MCENFYNFILENLTVDEGFAIFSYLVELYNKYNKIIYIYFDLNGFIPIAVYKEGHLKNKNYIYYFKIKSFSDKKKQPRFLLKKDNKNFTIIQEVKEKYKKK